jgi:hypothetical protein
MSVAKRSAKPTSGTPAGAAPVGGDAAPPAPAPAPAKPKLISTAEMGKRLDPPISEQAVRYWCAKRGAPHEKGKGGAIRIDPAVFGPWYARNHLSSGFGGKREKGKRVVRSTPPESVEKAGFGLDEDSPPSRPGKIDPGSAESLMDEDTPREIKALVLKGRDELDRILIAEKVYAERVKRQELEGTLVSADKARTAWLRACNAAGRRLRALPRSAAGGVCSRLGLAATAANIDAVREVLEKQIEGVCAALRQGVLGGSGGGEDDGGARVG